MTEKPQIYTFPKWVQYAAIAITALSILCFYFILISGTPNVAITLDDSRMFLLHFVEYWVNAESLYERMIYLVRMEKWPHPKIMGRIASLISYGIHGKVNMITITFLGNLGLLFTWILFYLLSKKRAFLYLLPISFLLFFVHDQNYWTILSFSYGYRLLTVGFALYFLDTKREYLSYIFSFLALFSGGVGFLVFPIIGLYFLIQIIYSKKLVRKHLFWGIWGLVCIFIFYYVTLDAGMSVPHKTSIDNETVGLFQKLGSNFGYILALIGQVTTAKIFSFLPNAIYLIIGFIGLSLMLGLIYLSDLKVKENRILSCLSIYVFLLVALAAFMRDDVEVFGELSPSRYMVYSIQFWLPLIVLGLNFVGNKYVRYFYLILSGLMFVSYVWFVPQNLESAKSRKAMKTKAFLNSYVGDSKANPKICSVVESKRTKCVRYFFTAINNDVFDAPVKDLTKMEKTKLDINSLPKTKSKVRLISFYKENVLKIRGKIQFRKEEEAAEIYVAHREGSDFYISQAIEMTKLEKISTFNSFQHITGISNYTDQNTFILIKSDDGFKVMPKK